MGKAIILLIIILLAIATAGIVMLGIYAMTDEWNKKGRSDD